MEINYHELVQTVADDSSEVSHCLHHPPSSSNIYESGKILLDYLQIEGEILSFLFIGDGDAAAAVVDASVINDLGAAKNESSVIQILTPIMSKAIEASREKRDLILLNSERHAYLKASTTLESDTAPDMLICHRAAAEEVISEADSTVDGVGFLYGRLANWAMRDMVSCVVKLKVKIGDGGTPFREVALYAKEWASTARDSKEATSSPHVGYMNWLLADATCFKCSLLTRTEALSGH